MGEISAHKIIEILVKSSREVPTAMLRGFSIVYKGSTRISNFCFAIWKEYKSMIYSLTSFPKSLSIVVIPGRIIFSCAVRRRYIEFPL